MKKIGIIGLLAIALTTSAWAVIPTHTTNTSKQIQYDNIKQRWDNLSKDQQKAVQSKAKAAWKSLSPQEQDRIKQHIRARFKWSQLSPAEQQQAIDNAKEALDVLPASVRRQLFRQQMQHKRPSASGQTKAGQARVKGAWKSLQQLPVNKRQEVID